MERCCSRALGMRILAALRLGLVDRVVVDAMFDMFVLAPFSFWPARS